VENRHQDPISGCSPGKLVETLRRQIARVEGARRHGDQRPVPSGCGLLDRLLAEGGFRRGTLVEWLAAGEGTGAGTLALAAAREACRDGGTLVVLDRKGRFYPPAAAQRGIDLDRLIVVQATSRPEGTWALDQALRSPAVAAALAWPEELDGRTFRRLQLAAEEGGGLGLLVRGAAARHEPSWADVRLLVEPLAASEPDAAGRLRLHMLRCRGGASDKSIDVEIDDETHSLDLAAQLADPTAHRRAAGT